MGMFHIFGAWLCAIISIFPPQPALVSNQHQIEMDVILNRCVRYNKRGSFWGIKRGFLSLSLSLIDPLYYTSTNPVYINGHKRTREREIRNHSRTDKPNKNKELIFRRTVEVVGKATTTTRRGVSSIVLVRRMLSNTKRCSQTHRRHTPFFFFSFTR